MAWIARLSVFYKAGKRVKSAAHVLLFLSILSVSLSTPALSNSKRPSLPPRKPNVFTFHTGVTNASPTLVSRTDAKLARRAFKAIDRNRYKDARKISNRISSQNLKQILLWQTLIERRSAAKFKELKRFLEQQKDNGQDWPKRRTLMKRAEAAMPSAMPPLKVLDWFQVMGGPVSISGRIRQAEAQLSLTPSPQTIKTIRNIWIQGNFTKRQEKRFYRRYKKYITKADNVARLERLIWSERFWPARRQIWKVDENRRKLAVARLWLMRREGNVDRAIRNVEKTAPQLVNHAGLVFERARWRRRKNRPDDAANLILNYKNDLIRPDKWWNERAILARGYLQKNQPEKAYALTRHHGLTKKDPGKYSDAEWLSGWIQLRFLNNPKRALKHFTHMLEIVNYPISMARGAYWSGRAAETLGRINTARKWMQKAAQYPTTYYGQLAAARLGRSILPVLHPETLNPTAIAKSNFAQNPIRKSAQILAEIGEASRMRPFIVHLADVDLSGPWQKLTADFATRYGRPDLAINVAKASERNGIPLGTVSYPALTPPNHKAINTPIEAPLVLAVIRQESAFYVDAKSRVGARGLMQLMPATAKRVARANRLPYDRKRLTRDPIYNLILGQAYLSGMIDKYKGSYPMALAAYNAGPFRVKRWIKSFGDPRLDQVDLIDWIEMIPYKETRNYIQRVLENLGVYRVKLSTQQAKRR